MNIDGIYIDLKYPSIPPKRPGRPRKYFYITLVAFSVLACVIAASYLFAPANVFVRKPIPLPTAENLNFLNQVTRCLIPTATLYGYDLRITAAFRSMTEQKQMYQQGRVEDGHIVSEAPPGHSLHNYGYAVDVADRTAGYNLNWTKLVKIAMYCHLESGGVGDLPHFEYRGGLTTDQFLSGMRPPPLTVPCAIMADRSATGTPLALKDLDACGAPLF